MRWRAPRLCVLTTFAHFILDSLATSQSGTDALSTTQHQKRVVSRPINSCPDNNAFAESRCVSSGVRTYVVSCRRTKYATVRGVRRPSGTEKYSRQGSCEDTEICILKQWTETYYPGYFDYNFLAYCVSIENFLRLAELVTGSLAQQLNFAEAELPQGQGNNGAVQAVLAGPDGNTSLVASQLTISAQTKKEMYNLDMWGTMANGYQQCTQCSSIGLDQIPAGTQRIAVNARLSDLDSGTGGIMYLAEVPF
ncbi:hypothetical protein MMC20_006346 [Loxospora ochrophaea]|nr:hypothetical protein [Loxospora ochrophaea]